MVKKIVVLALTVCMVVSSMTACGKKKEQVVKEPEVEEEIQEEPEVIEEPVEDAVADMNDDGKIVIGYITKNLSDVSCAPANAYLEKELNRMKSEGEIDDWTGILDGKGDAKTQTAYVEKCVEKQCDTVIISPAGEEASETLEALADNNINIIVIGKQTANTSDLAVAYCEIDNSMTGITAANWVVEQCTQGGKFVLPEAEESSDVQTAYVDEILKVLSEHEGFEIISQGEEDTVADGVFCIDDIDACNAQKECMEAGNPQTICIGVGNSKEALEMVRDKDMSATVYLDRAGAAKEALNIINALKEGKVFGKKKTISAELVTSDNVMEYFQ